MMTMLKRQLAPLIQTVIINQSCAAITQQPYYLQQLGDNQVIFKLSRKILLHANCATLRLPYRDNSQGFALWR